MSFCCGLFRANNTEASDLLHPYSSPMTSERASVRLGQVQAGLVRLILCLHFLLVVWRVAVTWGDKLWLLICAIIPFVVETFVTITRRRGLEWPWFSFCFFFYSVATLPGIWLLEIKRTETIISANDTTVDDITIPGLDIPLRLSSDTWVVVVEELMLYLMILGRWILPRGHVGREELSQLLFAFLGMASDIMDLFSLFEEDIIRHDINITYALLAVWSWSVLQFSLTFHMAKRPKRARGLGLTPDKQSDFPQYRREVIGTELAASLVSLFMQDGPFLALRLYTVVKYQTITHSLVFFTCKNLLVISLLFYKIIVLCRKCAGQMRTEDEDLVSSGVSNVVKVAEGTDRDPQHFTNSVGDKRDIDLAEFDNPVDLEESDKAMARASRPAAEPRGTEDDEKKPQQALPDLDTPYETTARL